jgi:hypothetical protein
MRSHIQSLIICEQQILSAFFSGWLSTAVMTFDPLRMVATTRSGRTYQLRGEPGCNADAQYVWEQRRAGNGVQKSSDVSAAVYEASKGTG